MSEEAKFDEHFEDRERLVQRANAFDALVDAAKIGIRMGEGLAEAYENRMTETFREEMEKMREALKAAGVKP